MKNKWWLILIVGIGLRLLVSAVTWHPDFRPFQFTGQVLASGNILNLYDYLNQVTDPKIHQIILLNYPPAIYWTFGLFSFVVDNILQIHLLNAFLVESAANFGDPLFSLHLLLIKSVYLLFDIPCAFLLAKLFAEPRQKLWAFSLWMFNPINLMATYMMGQFDVIPVFFTIASLVLVKQKRFYVAALMLGLGVAYKIYPLYLLVPLLLLKRTWWDRLKMLALGLLPYVVSVLPYLPSRGYRTTALLAGQSLKSFYAQVPISGGESIILFPVVLGLVYFIFYYQGVKSLWRSYLVVLLIFFILTHTHPQWLLWLSPVLIIELVESKFRYLVLSGLILVSWLGLLLFFDPSLSVGFFAPIWPQLYNSTSLWQWWALNPDYTLWRSLLQSLFVAAAVGLIYFNLTARGDQTD